MQIAYHIGAHATDDDRLFKTVLGNVDVLLQNGVAVPGPGKYRNLIRSTIQGLDGAIPAAGARDILLDSIVEDDDIDRLLLFNANFICVPNRIFEHGVFYPQAETKPRALRQLFPHDDLSFYIAIKHPATFLQDVLPLTTSKSIGELLGLMHPTDIRWSDVIKRIKGAAPNAEIIVWCNEDTPLIWARLLRLLTNVDDEVELTGGLDLLPGLIAPEGLTRLRAHMAANPPETEFEYETLVADIWEEFPIPDAAEEDIDLPELGADMVAAMSDNYEADIAAITAMDGVTMVLPFT